MRLIGPMCSMRLLGPIGRIKRIGPIGSHEAHRTDGPHRPYRFRSPIAYPRSSVATFRESYVRGALGSQSPDESGLGDCPFPNRKSAHAKEVAIVAQQFLKAGARNAKQLHLHLFGGSGNFATSYDVLFPRSGRLDHLINGAVQPGKKPLTESISKIINKFGLSIRKQFSVIPALLV